MVYATVQKVNGGWDGCGYSVAPIKERPEPIQWSKVGYSKHAVVIFGTVSDNAIKKVRVYFMKPTGTTVASVDANGFFLKPISTNGVLDTGIMVEGLDSSNRIV
jgi:hypothetical protein